MSSPDPESWVGAVVRSDLDARVWVVALADGDTHSGAMQATTSLRRAKGYATEMLSRSGIDVRWIRSEDGQWDAYETPVVGSPPTT